MTMYSLYIMHIERLFGSPDVSEIHPSSPISRRIKKVMEDFSTFMQAIHVEENRMLAYCCTCTVLVVTNIKCYLPSSEFEDSTCGPAFHRRHRHIQLIEYQLILR